jgi:hypothetical protein
VETRMFTNLSAMVRRWKARSLPLVQLEGRSIL